MRRRTLDIIFSAGGLALGIMLLALGFVLQDQGAFADDYVADQLGQQRIVFATAEKLTEEEKNWKPGSVCLVENAGKTLTTGKQAECYANYYIAMHMDRSAKAACYEGETYATMGAIRTGLQQQVTDAKAKSDTAAAEAAQKKLDAATSLRSTFQTGETLRGLLLTSFGFSIFGDKATLVASILFILTGLMALLSVAGFIHAFVTPREKVVGIFAAPPALPTAPVRQ